MGEELKTLLTPTEYDSAKRTTFNAFYTSPTVIATIHEAIARLGVPANATILEPGCGTGNFMGHGRPGARFIGVEMDSISGRIAKALHPGQDIRIENFRDTTLAGKPHRRSGRQRAVRRRKARLPGPEALAARLLLRQVHRRPEARRRAGPGHHPLHARQAECRHPRAPCRRGRFYWSDTAAVGCLQAGRNRRGHRHRVSSQAGTRPDCEPRRS